MGTKVPNDTNCEQSYLIVNNRDTLVCGFEAGLKNESDSHPLSQGHLQATRALLELALIMTSRKIS